MNKIIFGFTCFILMCKLSHASAEGISDNSTCCEAVEECCGLTTAEVRAAAFFPMGDRFRDIYGDVGVSVQLEVGRAFECYPCLGMWGNLEWIFMDSGSRGSCGRSDVDILNISFGLKIMRQCFCDKLTLYAGLGPDIGIVFLRNKIHCSTNPDSIKRKENKTQAGIGGIVKVGGEYYFTSCFFVDAFAEYLYLPIRFHRYVDVGGFKVGAGIGLRF